MYIYRDFKYCYYGQLASINLVIINLEYGSCTLTKIVISFKHNKLSLLFTYWVRTGNNLCDNIRKDNSSNYLSL